MSGDQRPLLRAVVIGGGPAGLIAAETLASHGIAVSVYDQMPSMGRKFLLAGRSGLNLTHSEPLDELLHRYGDSSAALEGAVLAFGPEQLRAWAAGLGEDTYIGTSGRVFPDSWRATPLLRAWLHRLAELGVVLFPRHRWTGTIATHDGERHERAVSFVRPDGSDIEVTADIVVLALGGASWPRVGSDGRWVGPLRECGVRVTDLEPSNVGVVADWSAHFVERFEGVPLKNVAITFAGRSVRGDAMVTSRGLEGLPVYSHSAAIRDALASSDSAQLSIDLHPDLDETLLARRLGKRRPKDSVSNWLRRAAGLSPVAIAFMRECTNNVLPSDAASLASLMKRLVLEIGAVARIDRAISSSGGVTLEEIDDRFMLRRAPGVFVAGEMIDWDAPTGGYLLQACFSTGVAAANGALEWSRLASGGSIQ